MSPPKITTTFTGFTGGVTMLMVNAFIVYYFAGQYGVHTPAPTPVEQDKLPRVVQQAVDDANHNKKLLREMHDGTAPRDRDGVPLWHTQHQDFRDLIRSLERNTHSNYTVASEMEDHTHQRPMSSSTPTTTLPDDLSVIERIIRWVRG